MNRWNISMVYSLFTVCLYMLLQPSPGLSADDAWKRDPFAYESKTAVMNTAAKEDVSEAADVRKTEIKIRAIFTGQQGHLVAVIDGEEYVAGDLVGTALVKKIDQFGVVLVEDGITRRIGLFGPDVEWGNYHE